MYRLSRNLAASTSWNTQGMSRPVMGLFYLYHYRKPRQMVMDVVAVNWVTTGHAMATIRGKFMSCSQLHVVIFGQIEETLVELSNIEIWQKIFWYINKDLDPWYESELFPNFNLSYRRAERSADVCDIARFFFVAVVKCRLRSRDGPIPPLRKSIKHLKHIYKSKFRRLSDALLGMSYRQE
jgi:hypothetical protein